MTRLLAPRVIRFYDYNWKPCLNHKESPEIMQELARATQVPLETITLLKTSIDTVAPMYKGTRYTL